MLYCLNPLRLDRVTNCQETFFGLFHFGVTGKYSQVRKYGWDIHTWDQFGGERRQSAALKVQLSRVFFITWLGSELPALAYCSHEFKAEMSRKCTLQSVNSINYVNLKLWNFLATRTGSTYLSCRQILGPSMASYCFWCLPLLFPLFPFPNINTSILPIINSNNDSNENSSNHPQELSFH